MKLTCHNSRDERLYFILVILSSYKSASMDDNLFLDEGAFR